MRRKIHNVASALWVTEVVQYNRLNRHGRFFNASNQNLWQSWTMSNVLLCPDPPILHFANLVVVWGHLNDGGKRESRIECQVVHLLATFYIENAQSAVFAAADELIPVCNKVLPSFWATFKRRKQTWREREGAHIVGVCRNNIQGGKFPPVNKTNEVVVGTN